MVILRGAKSPRRGFIMTDLVVAIGIILIAMLPLAWTINADTRLFRATYRRAVAMEIVDGEMEILAAGAWRNVPEGTHPYAVTAGAAANLPPGEFLLTRNGPRLRLEWSSTRKAGIGPVIREVTVK